jgi:hypothetical protein
MGRVRNQIGSVLSADPIAEPTPDNYGFLVALGGVGPGLQSLQNPTPANIQGGIRTFFQNGDGIGQNDVPPSMAPTIFMRLNHQVGGQYVNAGVAFITPFEGPFCLPQ